MKRCVSVSCSAQCTCLPGLLPAPGRGSPEGSESDAAAGGVGGPHSDDARGRLLCMMESAAAGAEASMEEPETSDEVPEEATESVSSSESSWSSALSCSALLREAAQPFGSPPLAASFIRAAANVPSGRPTDTARRGDGRRSDATDAARSSKEG